MDSWMLFSFKKWLRRGTKAHRGVRRKPARPGLRLEALEDRTLLSAELVLDINAVGNSSTPLNLVQVGSTAFFTADDGVNGRELWKSDGTPAGTSLVKDITPGSST